MNDKHTIKEVFPIRRKGTMVDEEIDSQYLKEMMTVRMYKPEAFSPLYKYNICIMQDGNDYFQIGRIATLSDELHENDDISKTVFVGIHYKDKFDRRKKYHPDGEQQAAYIKFLIHEVVPLLDQIIPTSHMGNSRVLLGDSLAGTLALMTALKYPHTFGKVIMQSPFVNERVLDLVEQTKKANFELIEIYHTIGENESTVRTTDGKSVDFITANRALNKQLEAKSTTYYYKEIDTGEHTWKYWQQDIRHALCMMLQ